MTYEGNQYDLGNSKNKTAQVIYNGDNEGVIYLERKDEGLKIAYVNMRVKKKELKKGNFEGLEGYFMLDNKVEVHINKDSINLTGPYTAFDFKGTKMIMYQWINYDNR